MKALFTIPSYEDFIGRLAEGLWHEMRDEPFLLADTLVLLPTRRACRQLEDAFFHLTNATLLPRMRPLGDMDEDEFSFALSGDATILPAITPLRRQMLMTRLVQQKDPLLSWDQATLLAAALARLLDDVQRAHRNFENLDQLVLEQDLARHWQETVSFLKILTESWPAILKEEASLDPVHRHNLVVAAQIKLWHEKPPNSPVIVAGSTATMPATLELMTAIAALPEGRIVLPGLDQNYDEETWQAIGETHPQFSMKNLLERLNVKRHEVKHWPTCNEDSTNTQAARAHLLLETMRPPEVSDGWRNLNASKFPSQALRGLSLLELDNPQEEAEVIALRLRAALEKPHQTAAFVTPDRMLAARVIAVLERWDIRVDDSGGASLALQPPGSFLLNTLALASPNATPIDYLALLKHPLAALHLSPAECRTRARKLEMSHWRARDHESADAEILGWLETIDQHVSVLRQDWANPLPLRQRLKTHIALAETLATSNQVSGLERLWKGEAGEGTALWLDEWGHAVDDFPPLTGSDYQALFSGLIRQASFRSNQGRHPRLAILGTLEARLVHFDIMILGGLNEGVWPPEAAIDPWMSRPMKRNFGLPTPEWRIGPSAHDFVQLASKKEVLLTRARRSGRSPTVPSRFLLQLDVVLKALNERTKNHDISLTPQKPWALWARMMDKPETIQPMAYPEPRPPVALRPQQLPVTRIGLWMRNPYAIYAEYILKLKKLEPLEREAGAAERGTLIHETLEIFLKRHPNALPKNAETELLSIARDVFKLYDAYPEVMALWWPKLEKLAALFVAQEHARREAGIKPLALEIKGRLKKKNFTLTGRVDRIDRLPDGRLAVIDYKTGQTPSVQTVEEGLEPQLPLLALMVEVGGFEGIAPTVPAEVGYWKLSGGKSDEGYDSLKIDLLKRMREAEQGLDHLIEAFANENTPYLAVPNAEREPLFDDYAHLARLAEWGRTKEGE